MYYSKKKRKTASSPERGKKGGKKDCTELPPEGWEVHTFAFRKMWEGKKGGEDSAELRARPCARGRGKGPVLIFSRRKKRSVFQ